MKDDLAQRILLVLPSSESFQCFSTGVVVEEVEADEVLVRATLEDLEREGLVLRVQLLPTVIGWCRQCLGPEN